MMEKEFTVEVTMVQLEIDMSEDAAELLEFLAEETGFTRDKVIEYSIGNMLLKEAGEKFKRRRLLRKITQDSQEMGLE
jgi:hypothetical protein